MLSSRKAVNERCQVSGAGTVGVEQNSRLPVVRGEGGEVPNLLRPTIRVC